MCIRTYIKQQIFPQYVTEARILLDRHFSTSAGTDLRGAIGVIAPDPPDNRIGIHSFKHIYFSKITKY
jgi:hypothetical protein